MVPYGILAKVPYLWAHKCDNSFDRFLRFTETYEAKGMLIKKVKRKKND